MGLKIPAKTKLLPQYLYTLSVLESHISSKWNGFWNLGGSILADTIQIGLWFEELECKWCTLVPLKFISQSLLASPQSSRFQIKCPSAKCFYQVNFHPINPRCKKPHSLIIFWESYIWFWFLFAPPSFFEWPNNSMKSSEHSQGREIRLFKSHNKLQDSCLKCVIRSRKSQ